MSAEFTLNSEQLKEIIQKAIENALPSFTKGITEKILSDLSSKKVTSQKSSEPKEKKKPVTEKKHDKKEKEEPTTSGEVSGELSEKDIDGMNVSGLKEYLKKKGVTFGVRDLKPVLVEKAKKAAGLVESKPAPPTKGKGSKSVEDKPKKDSKSVDDEKKPKNPKKDSNKGSKSVDDVPKSVEDKPKNRSNSVDDKPKKGSKKDSNSVDEPKKPKSAKDNKRIAEEFKEKLAGITGTKGSKAKNVTSFEEDEDHHLVNKDGYVVLGNDASKNKEAKILSIEGTKIIGKKEGRKVVPLTKSDVDKIKKDKLSVAMGVNKKTLSQEQINKLLKTDKVESSEQEPSEVEPSEVEPSEPELAENSNADGSESELKSTGDDIFVGTTKTIEELTKVSDKKSKTLSKKKKHSGSDSGDDL